ncbi:MAG: D-alanyl-D-alanine carboxypeptidase [Clostridiales bacterium]|nr:D-alanyl-D-alanine carboxypeptidase [Clostridiales bacterium]
MVVLLKKLILLAVCVFGAFCFSVGAAADTAPQVTAKSAVLMNQDTGGILYAKDENTRRPMASTTKIMTALLTLESARANNRVVTITDAMVRVEGSSMGLLPGNRLSLKSLAAGMLTVSGNDAANSAAVAISGSVSAFADRMNRRAKELGLKDTHFVTPSGLDNEDHYTTARDLAALAAAAMKNPDFAKIAGSRQYNIEFVSPDQTRRFTNHNKLLSMYSGCTGVKTGFTKKSGRCLVSAAERNGVRLVAVTLNAPDDWNDHEKLLDYGFSQQEACPIDDSGCSVSVPVVGGTKESVTVRGSAGGSVILSKQQAAGLKRVVSMPKFLYAPVEAGRCVGTVRYTLEKKVLAETRLVAGESVPKIVQSKNIWQRFWENFIRFLRIQ